MHEMAITEEILRIALEHAQKAGARQITAIHVVVGELSSFVDDSVQFYFDYLSPGTLAEGAQLHFQHVPACVRCRQCGHEFAPQPGNWHCPQCGAAGVEVLAGREFRLDSIEVT